METFDQNNVTVQMVFAQKETVKLCIRVTQPNFDPYLIQPPPCIFIPMVESSKWSKLG